MAKRGRPRKTQELTVATPVDHAKLLKQFEQEQKVQLEAVYKQLALIRRNIDLALTQIGFMDNVDTLSEAAFRAGRAYGPLDQANDSIEEILDTMYNNNDLDHYEDIYEQY
jgi:hypothetical protein